MSCCKDRAVKAFTEEKMSCGQSVFKGFQKCLNITEEEITDAKAFGGGRAEGGVCGALYCAKLLCETEEEKKQMTEEFVAKTKFERCKDIKKNKTAACSECVEYASEILTKIKKA